MNSRRDFLTWVGGSVAASAIWQKPQGFIQTRRSGAWSSPDTWLNGRVPAGGARVHIGPGHRVIYDVISNQPVRAIFISGILTFAADRDTVLEVGLIRIGGELI